MTVDNSPERSEIVTPRTTEKQYTRRALKEKYRQQAETDALTGLPNLRGFNRRYNEEVQRILRLGEKATVLYLDANNLKFKNDADKTHKKGDDYLKGIANCLVGSTRTIDVVARIGGDEFAVILVGTDSETTKKLWEERMHLMFLENSISIAAGASEIDPKNPQGSIRKADKAMYRAKAKTKVGLLPGQPATRSELVIQVKRRAA